MTGRNPFLLIVVVAATLVVCSAQGQQVTVKPLWDRVVSVSKTTATLQVVVNPPLERGTPVHGNTFQALNQLDADYVRYVPWLPYPKLGVAELDPPTEWQDFLGLLADRSHDGGLHGRHAGAFRHYQLQHHSAMDVQDRRSRCLIRPIPTRSPGTTSRAPSCATPA